MRRAGAAATLAVLALSLIGGGPALAGPAGTWTRIAGVARSQRSTFDVGLARTADGRLHVLYTSAGAVAHRSLSADARRLSAADRVASFAGGVNPSVALLPGLRAFFAGVGEGAAVDRVLATSTSVDGRSWSPPARVSNGASPYAAGGLTAALGVDGTPVSAWGSASEGFHLGLDPALADGRFPGGGVSGPGLGVDSATGQVVAAWQRLASGRIAAQALLPPGGPVVVPRSDAGQTLHRVGVTGRLGAPGVYAAFTDGANEFSGRAAVWRFGAAAGRTVSAPGARHVTIAAAPEGRLWILWDRDGRIYARRSDRAAAAFGRLVSIAAPARTRAVHDLAGEGSGGPLDVLALAERPSGSAEWHRRLLPALTLTVRGGAHAVTLAVTDAGEPVRGARVAIPGVRAKPTSRRGLARFKLPAGRHRAAVTRRGYSPASARVRVTE